MCVTMTFLSEDGRAGRRHRATTCFTVTCIFNYNMRVRPRETQDYRKLRKKALLSFWIDLQHQLSYCWIFLNWRNTWFCMDLNWSPRCFCYSPNDSPFSSIIVGGWSHKCKTQWKMVTMPHTEESRLSQSTVWRKLVNSSHYYLINKWVYSCGRS